MPTQRELDLMADALEDALAAHRCPARCYGATVSSRFVIYELGLAPGIRLDAVRALSDDLARSLRVRSVRIGQRGGVLTLEIPRDDARPVDLLPLAGKVIDRPPVSAILGQTSDGAPLLLRLPSPDVAHVLIAGTTGSGKTVLLRSVILSLALRHAAGGLGLCLIDPRGGAALGCFQGLPQLIAPVVTEVEAARDILARIVADMERRDRSHERPLPVVILIDELADLLAQDRRGEIEGYLVRLVARGRNVGLHVIAATQRPAAEAVSGMVRANFPLRLVGKVASPEDAKIAAGQRGSGAESLSGRGDFVLVGAGQVLRFQAAYADDKAITACMTRLRSTPVLQPVTPAELPPAPQPDPGDLAQLADKLRPWWAEHGGQWGSKTGALHFLFGNDAPAGGAFWEQTIQAIRLISTTTTPARPNGPKVLPFTPRQ